MSSETSEPGYRSLFVVLEHFDIRQWDLLMVGDGSGQSWNMPAGWSVILIEQEFLERKVLYGMASSWTSGAAELMAYVHGMLWFDGNYGHEKRKRLKRHLNVHILCDSETIVRQGNRDIARRANSALWAALDDISRRGYDLHFHWIRRGSVGLHDAVDHLSREMRRLAQRDWFSDAFSSSLSAYDINPSF